MRHFWGKVIILVESEVARPTESALHCVTEKNITNWTSHWCRNLMTVLTKFTETHSYYLHKAYCLPHAWPLFVLGYILFI